jgi:NitT/TauT family transport system substrate-binding protein
MRGPGRGIFFIAGLLAALCSPGQAPAQTPAKPVAIRATLDFIRYGGTAPFDYARAKGYFAQYGIDATFDPAKGSQDAIARVASGVYEMGFADVSTLIEFTATHPDVAPKIVFIVMDRSPQVIASLKKANIRKPADLVGRLLASGVTDGGSKMFPVFLKLNGLTDAQVQRTIVDVRLRDAMLARGAADGVIAYNYTVVFNLKGLGIPEDDISLLYYADHGLDLYGEAIIASRPLLERSPETVKNFVRAAAHGWHDAIADSAPVVQAIVDMDATVRGDLEAARLKWLIDHDVITPDTRKNGLGTFDARRMQHTIDLVSEGFGLPRKPTIDEVYDARFMPPAEERVLPRTN